MGKHVVITGIGIVSPVGTGRADYWDALVRGKSGFRPVTLFDATSLRTSLAGEVPDFDPVAFLGKKGLRELDRSTRLLTVASKLAIEDSSLTITEENASFAGVAIGTTFGSLHSIFQFDRSGLIDGPRLVNPSHFPNTVINSPASRVSIRCGLKGFNTTISTGFCAGLDAISYGCDFIRLNRADFVLAGGLEELCEETFVGFLKLGYLSGSDNAEPRCCPFDRRRNGMLLSEGAVVITLEDEDYAVRRGGPVLARVAGYGNAFDPSPNKGFDYAGSGLKKAVENALKESSVTTQDIECIFAGANSTQGLDRMETEVIKEVFGERAYSIPVTAIKSVIGETFSASGAFAVAAAVGALQYGIIPPTIQYQERDPSCNLDYVPNEARRSAIKHILVISSDPYGNNSAVIVEKHERID